ncbi:MAG: mechanosensitive ion channel [Rhodanobacteraceae bacterium]|nr:mechanosensitive ion channel [Xanthomonadales bacterium]MCP5478162.1 mechanosensitive ion channel [Rhodanobacteraceae bacterium]HPF72846.1 mechanosensitive ion channel [Xanthomonadaceae bacterium]HRX99087.1 mechanosensitive ion channel [Xanthomonadaceae bacterium]
MQELINRIDWAIVETTAWEWGGRILAALAIFLIGRWVARRISKIMQRAMQRAGSDPTVIDFMGKVGFGVLLVLVCVAALDRLGVPSASLVAAVGAAGLAVGLAMQGSLANLASGVLIILFKPFRNGDFVEVGGMGGTVREVGMLLTRLTTGDNREVSMPNAQVLGNPIINYSAKPTRRIDLLIGIGYAADAAQAMDIIRGVLAHEERVLNDPEPVLMVESLNESSVDLMVRPWVNTSDYWPVRGALLRDIKSALDEAGIEIPFPQRTVHVMASGSMAEAAAGAAAD